MTGPYRVSVNAEESRDHVQLLGELKQVDGWVARIGAAGIQPGRARAVPFALTMTGHTPAS